MSIKSSISAVLRKLRLLKLAEQSRYLIEKLKYSTVNARFRRKHPEVVMPPDFYIYETYKLNIEEYYYDGQATAAEIVSLISTYSDLSLPGISLLDWGCGPARITRHLPELLPRAWIYGSDYNPEYIEWCKRSIKGIEFSLNKIDPPTDHPDAAFDAIIGFSILTHLSASNHLKWIDELQRLLKPGGMAYITTQGRSYRKKMLNREQELFDRGELVLRQNVVEGNRLFSAFQPRVFMEKLFAGKFKVIEFTEASLDDPHPVQDWWLVSKA